MPTYNYYCSICDKKFSYFQKMSESPIQKCKKCNGKIDRIISGGAGLIFKGSGFYQTDYKNEKIKDSKKKESNVKNNKESKPKKVEKKSE